MHQIEKRALFTLHVEVSFESEFQAVETSANAVA